MTNITDPHRLVLDTACLEQSFAHVEPRLRALAKRFYARLFTRYPLARPMFRRVSMRSQRASFVDALRKLVANARRPHALLPELQQLGARHRQRGVAAHHYAV